MNQEQPNQEAVRRSRFAEMTPEHVTEIYEAAKKYIEGEYKIQLSTIELAGLRKIAQKVCEDLVVQETRNFESHSDFNPWEETPARFFLEFYGITPGEMKLYEDNMEALREFIRRKQDSLHMP